MVTGAVAVGCTHMLAPEPNIHHVHSLSATGTEESGLSFESRVNEFTLSNGLHFIVLERHNAPVVSCHTHARVGAFVEDEGSTGELTLLQRVERATKR